MIQPTPLSLSKMLSDLTAQHVSFALEPNAAATKGPALFATYVEMPNETGIIARVDRSLVAVLAGALLGIPDVTSVERAADVPKDAHVWDGINEVLNITSSAFSTQGRVLFKKVFMTADEMQPAEQAILRAPTLICNYKVAINSKPWGQLTLFC